MAGSYHPPADQAADLMGVTGAVRSYAAGASEEEKKKQYGQQKWGLFETNYQRSQGKTLDTSLQEIEDFSRHGVISGSAEMHTSGGARPGAGAGGFGSAGGGGGFGSAGGSGSAPGAGGFGSSGFGGSSSPGGAGRGVAGAGTGHFGPGGSAGAAFLQQHQSKEARKFMPEAKGGVAKPGLQ